MRLHRDMMRLRFELVPVEQAGPWGPERRLHWFGLTEGWFCLDVGGIELLRYTEQTLASFPLDGSPAAPPWADYYVVRLWEDMLTALPYILEPVPDDLVDFVAAGSAEWADTDDLEIPLIDAAYSACGQRCVDTSYLRFGPTLRWWRTLAPVDTVIVDWQFAVDPDGKIAFTAPLSGRTSVSTDEFVAAVTDFDHRLLEAMQQRVDRLAATGVPPGVELDIPGLVGEQAQRRTWLPQALAQQVGIDWDAVRAAAAILAPRIGRDPALGQL
ncbi:hypothetical protein IU450_38925 [Nocardia abscessus]|uniref:DUF5984 family protein n=1 Tax=Nocardia abscessus TaxID=120957 RepID=UPI0018939722|nr:DUF5984 family protein [Nocardia abscessus]MBF6341812.1 hypothetical protein [Nocardia abscessus]